MDEFFAVMELLCCAAALLRAAMDVFLFSNLPLPPSSSSPFSLLLLCAIPHFPSSAYAASIGIEPGR